MDRHDSARRHAGEHAVRSEQHVLDVSVGEDADAHDVARRPDVSRACRDGCGGVGKGRGGLRTTRPEHELMAVLHDAARNGRALTTESDEANSRHAVTTAVTHALLARVEGECRAWTPCVLLVSEARHGYARRDARH